MWVDDGVGNPAEGEMARALHQLKVKQIESEKRPGRYADGGGLYLQVQRAVGARRVTKSWLFRYTLHGRAREMGLGPLHTVPLASSTALVDGKRIEVRGARDLAADARRLLLAGIDPIEARKQSLASAQLLEEKSKPFRECAEAFIRAHRAGWRNAKHAWQWETTLETYCYPTLGNLPVSAIDTGLVLKVLEPIWHSKPETASRLRGRIEKILDWAKVRGYRTGSNPAHWRGHLDQTLPRRSKIQRTEHHAALPFDEAPAFMKLLRGIEGTAARALEFIICTAARTGEVIGAKPSEYDLDQAVWTIPASRMKAGREHRVPLSAPALEIAKDMLKAGDDFAFPGRSSGGLSNMACLKLLERMGRDDITVHGFRSTFRDWASERTNFPREVIEMALAHAIGDKVEAAYRRGDLFEKRRKLMDAWATFLAKEPATVHQIEVRREKAASAQ
jgi:integrase